MNSLHTSLQAHSMDDGWGSEDDQISGTHPVLVWVMVVLGVVGVVMWIRRGVEREREEGRER